MKKVILVISTLFSLLQAEITQKQLNDYMKISLGGSAFNSIVNTSTKTILRIYQTDINHTTPESLQKIKDELYSLKYINSYTKELKKLSLTDYKAIMAFYEKDISKRYKSILPKTLSLHPGAYTLKPQEELGISIDTTFSHRKKALILSILNTLDVFNLKLKLQEQIEIYTRNTLPKRYKVLGMVIEPIEFIQEDVRRKQKEVLRYQKEVSTSWFRYLTEKELEEMLEYMAPAAAKAEYRAIVTGFILYYETLMDELMKDKAQEIEAMMKKQKMTK